MTVSQEGMQAAGRAVQRHLAPPCSFPIYCHQRHDLCGQGQEQLGRPGEAQLLRFQERDPRGLVWDLGEGRKQLEGCRGKKRMSLREGQAGEAGAGDRETGPGWAL